MTTVTRSIPFVFEAQSFGALVRQRRDMAGLSQVDFGSLIGRSGTYISRIELWKVMPEGLTLTDYLNICNLLDLNPSAFFNLSE